MKKKKVNCCRYAEEDKAETASETKEMRRLHHEASVRVDNLQAELNEVGALYAGEGMQESPVALQSAARFQPVIANNGNKWFPDLLSTHLEDP